MNIEIFDKGNAHSRLTVSSTNEVRIKIGTDIAQEDKEHTVNILKYAAQQILDNGLNLEGTLRGTHKPRNTKITVYTNSKNLANRTKYTIDLYSDSEK